MDLRPMEKGSSRSKMDLGPMDLQRARAKQLRRRAMRDKKAGVNVKRLFLSIMILTASIPQILENYAFSKML